MVHDGDRYPSWMTDKLRGARKRAADAVFTHVSETNRASATLGMLAGGAAGVLAVNAGAIATAAHAPITTILLQAGGGESGAEAVAGMVCSTGFDFYIEAGLYVLAAALAGYAISDLYNAAKSNRSNNEGSKRQRDDSKKQFFKRIVGAFAIAVSPTLLRGLGLGGLVPDCIQQLPL